MNVWNQSASYKLKTFLMLAQNVMAAVRAVVGFVKAGVHNERQTAEERTNTTSNCCTPHIGGISTLLIYDCGHIHFAARASQGNGVVIHQGSRLK